MKNLTKFAVVCLRLLVVAVLLAQSADAEGGNCCSERNCNPASCYPSSFYESDQDCYGADFKSFLDTNTGECTNLLFVCCFSPLCNDCANFSYEDLESCMQVWSLGFTPAVNDGCTQLQDVCCTDLNCRGTCYVTSGGMSECEARSKNGNVASFLPLDGECELVEGGVPIGECCEDADCSNDCVPCTASASDLGEALWPYFKYENTDGSWVCLLRADVDGQAIQDNLPTKKGGQTDKTKNHEDSGIIGDPHIMQWNGNWFDFQGECDLVLVQAKALDLTIHVRTTIRYDYSYIESAALQIGSDILEVGSWGDYFFNGILSAKLEALQKTALNGFPIYYKKEDSKHSRFDVVLSPTENITISTLKDIVSVKIRGGSRKHFGDSVGIMGSFDGELKMRDGTVVSESEEANWNKVSQEWQVKEDEPMLFQTIRPPQAPMENCRLPDREAQEKQRRLGEAGVSQEAAQEACAHLTGEAQKACVFDVLAFGDVDLAGGY